MGVSRRRPPGRALPLLFSRKILHCHQHRLHRPLHLNYLTSSAPISSTRNLTAIPPAGEGIDHFSYNICEDHLIGDLLWRSTVPSQPNLGNHALLFGDLGIQPIANMSISAYVARRVRWLRVRKYTVTLATLERRASSAPRMALMVSRA